MSGHTFSAFDATVLKLSKIKNQSGSITAINNDNYLPFDIKRVYYLYDVPSGESRGGHGHRRLHQLIVAASGSFTITVDDGVVQRAFTLSNPDYGLYMPPGLWREMDSFSGGAICLVLASEEYSEDDYFRDYDNFKNYRLAL